MFVTLIEDLFNKKSELLEKQATSNEGSNENK
jgi:hypothetical protein